MLSNGHALHTFASGLRKLSVTRSKAASPSSKPLRGHQMLRHRVTKSIFNLLDAS